METRPTFQQTFGKCPFPEGVLSALGACPVSVRVRRAERAMEVDVESAGVDRTVLDRAAEAVKSALRLNEVAFRLIAPAEEDKPTELAEAPKSGGPMGTSAPTGTADAQKPDKPAPPPDLSAQMAAMRKRLIKAEAAPKAGGQKRARAIYGKINAKKKITPIGELDLDMRGVLIEGDVFNVEHRELPGWCASTSPTTPALSG